MFIEHSMLYVLLSYILPVSLFFIFIQVTKDLSISLVLSLSIYLFSVIMFSVSFNYIEVKNIGLTFDKSIQKYIGKLNSFNVICELEDFEQVKQIAANCQEDNDVLFFAAPSFLKDKFIELNAEKLKCFNVESDFEY